MASIRLKYGKYQGTCWAVRHPWSVIILCIRSANERRCYNVTSSLIGWAHTQNEPCWYSVVPQQQYIFSQILNKHPIARLWGQDMEFPLWDKIVIYFCLLYGSAVWKEHHVILDSIMMTPDCIMNIARSLFLSTGNFLPYHHNRYPIAHPWGWMGCQSWGTFHYSLQEIQIWGKFHFATMALKRCFNKVLLSVRDNGRRSIRWCTPCWGQKQRVENKTQRIDQVIIWNHQLLHSISIKSSRRITL